MQLRKMLAGLTILCVLGGIYTPGSVDARTEWRKCGSQRHIGAGWYNVRALNVRCTNARRVARKYWNTSDRRITVNGVSYRCRRRQVGSELFRVRCRAGEKRVRFQQGS